MKKIFSISMLILFLAVFVFSNSAKKCVFADNTPSYKAMATMEKSTGRLLYSYNEKAKLPMASTTKIITAITVIENCANLDDIMTIPKEAQGVEGSSIYLRTGEHLSVRDLLYGLMLQSGNDAAVALAIYTSGSIENFILLANEMCKKIGALDTNLVTPNGLHDKYHYTTAYDLALITCYALKNETFKQIVSTKFVTIPNETGKEPRYLKNKNRLLNSLDGCTGVKTGYTSNAGRCLVASSEKNGMEVVAVVLNCAPMFEECAKLLGSAHSEYELIELLPEYEHLGSTMVKTRDGEVKINMASKEGFVYPLTKIEQGKIRKIAKVQENLSEPIEKDESIGEIEIFLSNQLLFRTKIFSIDSVRTITFKDYYKKVIEKMI